MSPVSSQEVYSAAQNPVPINADTFAEHINQGLNEWFMRESLAAPTVESSTLFSRMGDLANRGGKRIRPYLGYVTYCAYGGEKAEELTDIFLASELYHRAMLIHDDIIDGDMVRYDGPNISGSYAEDFNSLPRKQQLTMANAMALIAGDAGISFAYKAILQHPSLQPQKKVDLANLLTDTNVRGQAGQQLDTLNIAPFLSAFSNEKIVLTHLLKSSLYTTQFPMRCAGVLLDLPQAEMSSIDRFAEPLGILYQLVDDYSDYFPNPTRFDAKPKYRDYRQGKLTMPLFNGLQDASPDDAAFMCRSFGDTAADATTIERVVAILETSGSMKKAHEQIGHFALSTSVALHELTIDPVMKPVFTALVDRYLFT